MVGLSTALIFKRIPAAQLSKSAAMIVRATLVRIALLSTALGALTGCDTVGGAMSSAGSSVGGFFSHRDPNAEGLNLGAGPDPKRVVLQATARPSDKLKVLPVAAQDINCPEVTVADGGAALRVGGADNASVRYQFNIGDTARQCDPAGPGQAAIKIGVAGEVVIGPAGSAGTFSAPIKITDHAGRQRQTDLFAGISRRGDDGRGQGRPVSHCHRSDQCADVDAPARGRLFDHGRL